SERRSASQEDVESGLELSDYDNHPADAASETFERTRNYALDENFREILEAIDEALRKIEDGTYGICDRCSQPINIERLKAIPYATLCIQCQETIERR
ncbi:MAG: TraR/DksA C4-type zinc finger protein, partial [Armatimonadetes bacterium]|nr:TraR/DksA C4-type zinc finger protein [Armatimonadota bacterium]